MRFHRLDLLKYGRFTDRSVEFPAAPQDFHLIVGPNEAGKSTLRSAILDLLFGIPMRSQMGFLHPINELRLGGLIGAGENTLEFHRSKARKETLRSPDDAPLDDSVLAPFLGTANRDFFDRMFGLDHTRLVEGGNSILSAEDDVGQILFQSAAGVASLGKIRDALLAEADALWGPRKAADREYYAAAAQLDQATAALKLATVRTKAWTEASGKVEDLQEAIATETRRQQDLQARRGRLERVRRLAPHLQALREGERQLAELGEVADLPADAAETFARAENELAAAQAVLDLRRAEFEEAQAALETVHVDAAVLDAAGEITALEQRRVQYGAYARDIENRKVEIDNLWRDVCAACGQLGWPSDSAESVTARVPTLLVRRELGRLARDHGGIMQRVRAAEDAERSRRAEIERISEELTQFQLGDVSPALRAALASARALGDFDSALQKDESAVARARTAADTALHALGRWSRAPADLRAMMPPSRQALGRWVRERQDLEADRKAATQNLDQARADVARLELEISQFRAMHDPTTRESVLEARRERDTSWSAITRGEVALEHGAPSFEASMHRADELADARLDDVEGATALQNLLQQLERVQQHLASADIQQRKVESDLQAFDTRWSEVTTSLGLPGLALDDIDDWLAKRERALAADDAYQEAQQNKDQTVRSVANAKRSLLEALRESGIEVPETFGLRALCVKAEDHIKAIDDARARFETLSRQLATARSQVSTLHEATERTKVDAAQWTDAWSNTLAKAGLAAGSEIGTVEGVLELIASIEDKLGKMRQIRTERIDAMNNDLERFSVDAQCLVQKVAGDLDGRPAAEIAQALAKRLIAVQEAFAKAERLKLQARRANEQAEEIRIAIRKAQASLKPLMERAGVDTNEALNAAITRSDARRRLTDAIVSARGHLLKDGDGFDQAHIEQEVDAADRTQLGAELAEVNEELSRSSQAQNSLSAELANAQRVLADIGGSDAAARAEAQRQEALARMSDVAERYVKVFTAARLLRWSIDRYRQEKQGPLLARASAIFSNLTLGSFQRLIVDFDQEPMALEGQRGDGKLVGVSGMSDGTRDQLYLALRLAALEMHLDQAVPLPFIADDLFINYDDARSRAGIEALGKLSERTQVIFLSHHDHLVPTVRAVFGSHVNVVEL